MTADEVISALQLTLHPEGGHYREVFRDVPRDGGRGAVTSIYYLLKSGERSHWHRVDAVEIWHHHGGDGLVLTLSNDGKGREIHHLGGDLNQGQKPQVIVPAGWWQSARPADQGTHGWSLAGCTVAPAFDFDGFDMAPNGWAPGEG